MNLIRAFLPVLFWLSTELSLAQRDPEANEDRKITCFDDLILDFMVENDIPGVSAAVMYRGDIVYSQGYGYRDVPGVGSDEGRRVSHETTFRIASISKSVTSLAVMKLVENGVLSLSDRVFGSGGILEWTQGIDLEDDRVEHVTVYQLLAHTGGWDDEIAGDPMFGSKEIASELGIEAPATCTDIIFFMLEREELQHDPGSTFSYSNFGYCVLGRVIEEVTELGYEEAVRQLILDPAGVSRTGMYLGSTLLSSIPSYETEYYCPGCGLFESVFPTDDMVPDPYGGFYVEAMDAHGGWVSTAEQLMIMLASTTLPHCETKGCILSPASLDALGQPSVVDDYGLGFQLNDASDLFHTGSLPGTETLMVNTNEEDGYAWAILANSREFKPDLESLMREAVECVDGAW